MIFPSSRAGGYDVSRPDPEGFVDSRSGRVEKLHHQPDPLGGTLDDAIMVDERAPETLEDTIRVAFTEEEARALLRASGMDKGNLSHYAREIFR